MYLQVKRFCHHWFLSVFAIPLSCYRSARSRRACMRPWSDSSIIRSPSSPFPLKWSPSRQHSMRAWSPVRAQRARWLHTRWERQDRKAWKYWQSWVPVCGLNKRGHQKYLYSMWSVTRKFRKTDLFRKRQIWQKRCLLQKTAIYSGV